MVLPAGPKRDGGGDIPAHLDALAFCEWWGGTPYRWQLPIVEALCATERPTIAYVQVPRKNGKSYLAAVVAIDEMVRHGGQVFLIADSERNLKSALFSELCKLVRESPRLSACVLTYKDHLECPGSGGQISLRPNNLSASQSINPTTVLFDEVHMQRTDSIWHGMSLAGDAAVRPLLLGITTPGYETVSLAHDLYEGVKDGAVWGVIHEAPADCKLDDDAPLLASNPILAERPELLDRFRYDQTKISEHDHRRFRLGQWTSTDKAWMPHGAWDARKIPASLNLGDRVWLGFDGSHSHDSTALVACGETGHLTVLNVWEKPITKLKTPWRVPRHEVVEAVARAFADFDVQMMHGDPPYWNREFQEWDEQYPDRVVEFPWASPARSGPACSAFYAAAMDGQLSHDGDIRLAKHVANAVSRPTPHGVVIEKWNRDSPRRIDVAVAAVLAYHGLATGQRQVKDVHVW